MNKTMLGVGRFGHCDNTKEDFKIIEMARKRQCLYRRSIFETTGKSYQNYEISKFDLFHEEIHNDVHDKWIGLKCVCTYAHVVRST